jgi:NAD-dependent SIR2 family protein deacetylase
LFQLVRNCDALLVLGTSGVVFPVLFRANQNGTRLIGGHPTENAFSSAPDLYIILKTDIALPEIEKQRKALT